MQQVVKDAMVDVKKVKVVAVVRYVKVAVKQFVQVIVKAQVLVVTFTNARNLLKPLPNQRFGRFLHLVACKVLPASSSLVVCKANIAKFATLKLSTGVNSRSSNGMLQFYSAFQSQSFRVQRHFQYVGFANSCTWLSYKN